MDMNIELALGDDEVSMDDITRNINRSIGVHEINQTRTINGEYHTLFPILKRYPEKFKSYVRMLPSTFEYVLSQIQGKLVVNWCNFQKQPIYAEERLVLTLRFLATGQSYSQLGFSFRMGTSTVCAIIKRTLQVIWEVLGPQHMPVPTEDEFRNIADGFFKRWNFPHCLGGIDCRHMRCKQPRGSKKKYFNWKKFYSVKIQAVVDSNYKFIFIEVGDYGSTHDSTTYFRSKLYKALKCGKLKLPQDERLRDCGITLPYFFIGDGAYMLQEHLMKPYRGKNLPVPHQKFNKRLSRARMVVECAFGHLVQIWRIFLTTMQHTPETVTLITKSACLLRNIIIDKEGTSRDDSMEETASIFGDVLSGGNPASASEFVIGYGKEVRADLTQYIMDHPIE